MVAIVRAEVVNKRGQKTPQHRREAVRARRRRHHFLKRVALASGVMPVPVSRISNVHNSQQGVAVPELLPAEPAGALASSPSTAPPTSFLAAAVPASVMASSGGADKGESSSSPSSAEGPSSVMIPSSFAAASAASFAAAATAASAAFISAAT